MKFCTNVHLAADIPLHYLNHPTSKSLCCQPKRCSIGIPKKEKYSRIPSGQKSFLIVDKEVSQQKYIQVRMGSFDIPYKTYLIEGSPLESSSNVNGVLSYAL